MGESSLGNDLPIPRQAFRIPAWDNDELFVALSEERFLNTLIKKKGVVGRTYLKNIYPY